MRTVRCGKFVASMLIAVRSLANETASNVQLTWTRTMNDPLVPRVGGVISADIAVPEHEREVRFYSRVLTTGENPLWREDLMNNQGTPIIGLGARSEEYAHLPLQWMPHIQVADVATSVKRALDLGGSELMLDEANQWAVLLDPNGRSPMLWQHVTSIGRSSAGRRRTSRCRTPASTTPTSTCAAKMVTLPRESATRAA